MNTVKKFLQDCETFHLATTDGDHPRVRPFGAVSVFEDRLYIATASPKNVSKQIKENPKFEISATLGQEWIRLNGKLVLDDRTAAKAAMLDENPALKSMYSVDDGIFEVYYITGATANILSFEGRNDTIQF